MSNDKYRTENFDCAIATVGRFYEKDGNGNRLGKPIKVQIIEREKSPHVQILRANDGLRASVKLDKPEYLHCKLHTQKLTEAQIDGLIDFFNSPSDFPVVRLDGVTYKLKTMWDYTIVAWNRESDDDRSRFELQIDGDGYLISPQMPNYTNLDRGRYS